MKYKTFVAVGITFVAAIVFVGVRSGSTNNNSHVIEIPVSHDDSPNYGAGRTPASLTQPRYLTPQAVDAMVKQRDHLHEYASAEPMSGGWKITLRPQDRLLGKIGFHTGDVVTFADLAQAPLGQQVADLLRSIEQ